MTKDDKNNSGYEQLQLEISKLKIAIIGGGLVGPLAAIHLAKFGYEVHLYESHEDIRKIDLLPGRSLNMSMAVRGQKALAMVGLEDEIVKYGIAIKGRMIHKRNGQIVTIPYDSTQNQCIYSLGRKPLNEILLTASEAYPNIHLHFNQKLIASKVSNGELNFINPSTNEKTNAFADLVIGCDGAYSAVRKQMMQKPGFEYSQTYIEHGYLELLIPPRNGEFAMPHNYAHVWPRGQFMLVAFPNANKTWTVTLIMPFVNFEKIKTEDDVIEFFTIHFEDIIDLIGRTRLIEDFYRLKPLHMVSIKCQPFNFGSNVLLMGDAAHAMVPFFGQGMNAGFEDCTFLTNILKKHGTDFATAFKEFSDIRCDNAHAICDLSMYNYIEMRDLVTRSSYSMRKKLDEFLYFLMPNKWVPLNVSVLFSNMPYTKCVENRNWQNNVGSLAAIHLGKIGYEVHLYEYREDIRKSQLVAGRSINLALSVRGRKALAEIGLEEELLNYGIPMRGRMLHDIKGQTTFIPYDVNQNQCIYSVGRKHLNDLLLTAAHPYPNIHLHFNQKLITAKLRNGELNFINPSTKETSHVVADLVIGCDGAYSAVRKHMMQTPGFDYSQTYIRHGYIELCIPTKNGEFAMPHNYLHIWPRGQFMMIALPNQDKTWTVTLFMPFHNFDDLKTEPDLLEFFNKYFKDAITLIGQERLIDDFFKARPQHLVSVKCRPYHIDSKVLLMGDAAHAMVPFFGQGMNAGFEDCSLLTTILKKHGTDFTTALKEFSDTRCENAHAICDLAMYNYIEMRDLVTRFSYRMRKKLDDFLFWIVPNKWVPLYNSVTFSHMPYKKCMENRQWQNKVLTSTMLCGLFILLGCGVIFGQQLVKHNNIDFSTEISSYISSLWNCK